MTIFLERGQKKLGEDEMKHVIKRQERVRVKVDRVVKVEPVDPFQHDTLTHMLRDSGWQG